MYLKPIFLSLILLGTARGGQRPNILFLFADHITGTYRDPWDLKKYI